MSTFESIMGSSFSRIFGSICFGMETWSYPRTGFDSVSSGASDAAGVPSLALVKGIASVGAAVSVAGAALSEEDEPSVVEASVAVSPLVSAVLVVESEVSDSAAAVVSGEPFLKYGSFLSTSIGIPFWATEKNAVFKKSAATRESFFPTSAWKSFISFILTYGTVIINDTTRLIYSATV